MTDRLGERIREVKLQCFVPVFYKMNMIVTKERFVLAFLMPGNGTLF